MTMTKSILIVEDEPNIGMALEYMMQREGYELRRVADGEAALAAVAERAPDLILLDVMLPRRSGYEVCQSLREDPAFGRIKIVMMTAKGGAAEGEKSRALGADRMIRKPFASRELTATVRALLDEVEGEADRETDGEAGGGA